MRKYPRTPHLRGSRLQPGDEDLNVVAYADIVDKPLVIEEKIDGANCGISFSGDGALLLQSRGHYLTGGPRERQFNLLKSWASLHASDLHDVLGQRYILYGEWMYAKHTVFYDQLPHYFLEFDVLDLERDIFLSTEARRALLAGLPITSVPVLQRNSDDLDKLIQHSLFKSPDWKSKLPPHALSETDPSSLAEGLYIKWEEDGEVKGRYKYVRQSFLTAILDSGSHWMDRPIVPNLLKEGVDLFS
jgi:hypothetical protein